MDRDRATEVAQAALIWMAGEPDVLAGFLAATGVEPDALRAAARDPSFLGAVLDFVLGSDATVLAFGAAASLPPDAPARARAALPGGAAPEWT